MKIEELVEKARDTITVRRVYSEPYERDGVTVITAAAVGGGGGVGVGKDEKGKEGEGGGFGAAGRPVGAYVITGSQVSWRPAIDVNRLLTGLAAVLVAFLVTRARVARARANAERAWRESV
ncbi:sporulation protein [Umezawaea endophytica]|uniref:Sporulation protein n=1 Tax=Umezawaea endophytica TaxID=1654476 RepID=A0A9X2VHQ5_9PSEU|nr:sporulation protein [Umezawaea endophytica]MCS7475223.1 sporulation protein [Umezawaea endophytica]